MRVKGHGTIKKSKAYGVIGTLLLSGVLLTTFGANGVCADEVQASTSATVNSVLADVNSENYQADAGLSEETSDLPENDKANELNSESASSSINDEQSTTTTEQTEVNDDKSAVTDDSNSTGAESEQVDNLSENQTESIVDANANSQLTDESQNVKPEITANDNQKLVAERRATGNATDEVTSATLTNKGFDIQYNQTIPAGAKIMFAVWSEVNGQDDLIWYTADSNGHVVAKYTGSYGKYNIHTYQNLNGQMIGLNGRTIDVPKPSAKVTITKVSGTTYKVIVSDIPAYITSIQLPTWTEKGGQDDIQWYATTQNADGTFTRTFSIAEHNLESGQYNVHVYGTSAVTNSLTCLTGTSFQSDYHFSDVHVQPTLTANGIQISMPSDVSSDMTVYHAVWSAKNDQDDLIWYKVPANGQLTAKYTGDYGTYLIHTYAVVKGKMVCISATSIDVPKPSAKVTITKINETSYKVTVSDTPIYITSIQLPTWTEKGGQDDIQWYSTTKNADGTFTRIFSIAEHNLEGGKYNVHVYGTNAVTNSLTCLTGTSIEADYHFSDVHVQPTLTTNGIQISMPSDVSSDLTVYHAVWSANNDQDDLVWYKVPTNGQLTAKYTGDYGSYLIHTYAVVKGKMVCISATSINVPKPDVRVQIEKLTDYSAKVTVTDVPVYVHDIQLPTWTSKNGQDDMKWYHAIKQADGSYVYTFYAKNHKFESGHYNVHVYGTNEVTHSFTCLSGSDGVDLIFNESLTKPTVVVQNYDASKGSLEVVIAETESSKDISSVTVAAWSDSAQKNLHWYTSSNVSNGKVIIMVDEKYHHNISADYTVHVYVKTKDGETVGYNLGQYAFNNKEITTSVSTTYKGTGVYGVNISGIYSNGTVKYAVWSDVNDQDDIRWYDATTSGSNATGLINVANHSGTGTYHIHVYQSDNGQMYFLTSTEFTVKRTNFNTPYYNQRDGRWANITFGGYRMASTACAPTSVAMVVSSLTGTEILPTTVCAYLYNNTVEFNRGDAGTTGRGVVIAAQHWGMTATVIHSSSQLSEALKEGHHVLAAVQQDKFSPWGFGTSHEIVLKGYSNGNTYVYDPYNAANNGWYPIEWLWREQSTQSGDINGLGNPFVKVTDI